MTTATPSSTAASAGSAPSTLSDRLTVQEKLLLAQAVYKLGALSWPAVSKLLVAHPCCINRPLELFSPQACEGSYVGLMTGIGINVPAQDAMKPQAKVHLRLAQTFYLARMQELQESITNHETRFTQLMSEINAIKAGDMNAEIRAELRGVLARKYGKRLLDSWVPDVDQVKQAVQDGRPADGEEEVEEEEAAVGQDKDVKEEAEEEVEKADGEVEEESTEKVLGEGILEADEVRVVDDEETKNEEEDQDIEQESDEGAQEEDEDDAQPEPVKTPKRPSRAPSHHSELSLPGSDLSPAPSDRASAAPEEEEASAPRSSRSNKRKASTQPRGAPAPKRSGRRSNATAATASPAPTQPESEVAEPSEAEDEGPSTRGRRSSKRESTTRIVKKPQQSPAASTRTKGSSPAVSRRAPSVSSNTSATPGGAQEERRSSRRATTTTKGRVMRDDIVSKSVREQSAAVESVKAEEVEDEDVEMEEKKVTRASGRRKGGAQPAQEAMSTPTAEKRGTRASARTVRDSVENDGTAGVSDRSREEESQTVEPDSKPELETPASASVTTSTPAGGASGGRSSRNQTSATSKSSQKLLYSLLDTISSHRNGNVFQNPVKKSDAPDYHEVIRRPMDLKTIRGRIKDGHISSIDEFERDALLIFANAMMYNQPDSQVYAMAKEMLKDAESHIAHFRSMQHHMSR
ncbi:hypothetical protein IAR55_003826 [Kwoniella newhampshirensis]|uniref:Bromo domain-containing protein n=1 Tax=Kwoniella newhampshirensis TaxID=1651941 RepID=A0AAW0Z153_9TREE